MIVNLRYVTRRVGRNGSERWYWQRRGQPLTRLPHDLAERIAMAQALNNAADQGALNVPQKGTIGWVIEKYQESDNYKRLGPGTVKYYRRYLRDIADLGSYLPFATFDRRATVDYIESYEKPHQRRQSAAVLKNLFKLALYYGHVTQDYTMNLRLATPKPRDRLWTDMEIANWMTRAITTEDQHMTTAFLLLQFTAQRPGDVLAMTWAQYSGTHIRLRQEKTQALVEVPCHPVLKAHLDALPRTSLMLVEYRGRPVRYGRFNERFRRVCSDIDLTAQARDLRRTAMVRLAEAGATTPMIAAISGHAIDQTQRILDTYLPRNRDLADVAMARLVKFTSPTRV